MRNGGWDSRLFCSLAVVILFTFVLLIFGRIIGLALYNIVHFPGNFDLLWNFAQYVIPLATIAVVFVLLYRFTPNLRLTFREVLPDALFATVGWVPLRCCFPTTSIISAAIRKRTAALAASSCF
nr:YihY/virulence factor BrkB family protein [Paenibacillus tyrfis]